MNRKEFLTMLMFHDIKESKDTKNQYLFAASEKGSDYFIRIRPKQNTISFYYSIATWKNKNYVFQKKFYSYDLALKKMLTMREIHGTM